MDERERELADLAKRIGEEKNFEKVRAAIAQPALTDEAKNQDVFARLNAMRGRSDDRSMTLGLQKDFSWFVTDSHGVQKWRNPFQEPGSNVLTVGKPFAFRDYFHGRGEDYEPAAVPPNLEPIRQPHISRRFLGPNGSYLVAVAVPIWDADHKHVIGVLGRTIEIGSLLDEYGRAIFEETGPSGRRSKVSREIALFERVHGNLLDHTWFDKNDALVKSHPLTTTELDSLRVTDRLLSKLQRLNAVDGPEPRRDFVDDEQYIDPLSHFEPAAADLGGDLVGGFRCRPGDKLGDRRAGTPLDRAGTRAGNEDPPDA